jgi:hypothetical protein
MRFDVCPHHCGEVTLCSKNAAAAFVAAFVCPIAHTPTVAKITAPAKLHIRAPVQDSHFSILSEKRRSPQSRCGFWKGDHGESHLWYRSLYGQRTNCAVIQCRDASDRLLFSTAIFQIGASSARCSGLCIHNVSYFARPGSTRFTSTGIGSPIR